MLRLSDREHIAAQRLSFYLCGFVLRVIVNRISICSATPHSRSCQRYPTASEIVVTVIV